MKKLLKVVLHSYLPLFGSIEELKSSLRRNTTMFRVANLKPGDLFVAVYQETVHNDGAIYFVLTNKELGFYNTYCPIGLINSFSEVFISTS